MNAIALKQLLSIRPSKGAASAAGRVDNKDTLHSFRILLHHMSAKMRGIGLSDHRCHPAFANADIQAGASSGDPNAPSPLENKAAAFMRMLFNGRCPSKDEVEKVLQELSGLVLPQGWKAAFFSTPQHREAADALVKGGKTVEKTLVERIAGLMETGKVKCDAAQANEDFDNGDPAAILAGILQLLNAAAAETPGAAAWLQPISAGDAPKPSATLLHTPASPTSAATEERTPRQNEVLQRMSPPRQNEALQRMPPPIEPTATGREPVGRGPIFSAFQAPAESGSLSASVVTQSVPALAAAASHSAPNPAWTSAGSAVAPAADTPPGGGNLAALSTRIQQLLRRAPAEPDAPGSQPRPGTSPDRIRDLFPPGGTRPFQAGAAISFDRSAGETVAMARGDNPAAPHALKADHIAVLQSAGLMAAKASDRLPGRAAAQPSAAGPKTQAGPMEAGHASTAAPDVKPPAGAAAVAPEAPSAKAGAAPMPAYLINQAAKQIAGAVGRGDRVLHLRLKPPELGSMHVEIALKDNLLKLGIMVDNHQTRDYLLSGLHELKEMLSAQGIKMDGCAVQISYDFESSLAQQQDRTGPRQSLYSKKASSRKPEADEETAAEIGHHPRRAVGADSLLDLMA